MATVSKPVKLSKGDNTRADVQGVNRKKAALLRRWLLAV
jgi:hypothetical protein